MRLSWLLLLAAAGCSNSITEENGWTRRPGHIVPELSSIQMFGFPGEVQAGVPFNVVVHTVGSSSCTQPAGTEADVSGMRAAIRPFDFYAPGDQPCTDDLRGFRHEATLTFSSPGNATLVLHGRNLQGEATQYEATITVRPGTGQTWTRRVGVVDASISSVPLAEIPPNVRAGVPFQINVHTFGSSSCTRSDGAAVSLGGGSVDVTPYDRYAPPGPCTADLHAFDHYVTIVFDAVGEGRLRIHGRGGDGRNVTHTLTIAVGRP